MHRFEYYHLVPSHMVIVLHNEIFIDGSSVKGYSVCGQILLLLCYGFTVGETDFSSCLITRLLMTAIVTVHQVYLLNGL